ncbi:MAG TPA: valine--tRNA ligase [Vicinamibacteria bacterium]|nr:valine--tRNA ligase [Vicinamibacteria bacterium]
MIRVDPSSLPPQFDSRPAEEKWDAAWQKDGTYRFDEGGEGERFVIDTPPPTVSGSLHVGHVFSYTQTDVIARYQRMKGRNVFYPMGWDDNGLPTERRVQNYFHVRCEPGVAHDPAFPANQADDETRKGPPRKVSRRNFIDLCLALTAEDEKVFKALWQRLGLSVDWSLEYSTISDSSRRLAQASFLDLHAKGHVYNVFAPTMWDVDFRTAVAQAEVEDRPQKGAFHELRFGVEGGGGFVIATTRPELLPACVAVTAHPDDERYQGLFGKRAITPVFKAPVPIFASPLVDKDKGTGILMVCTFGDQTDVQWWREQKLPLRQVVGRNGQLVPVEFGTESFPSLDPARANAAYALLAGKSLKEAQKAMVELLRDPGHAASGEGEAPLQGEPKAIEHAVKFFEKGDRPLEFVTTRQWFVRILDRKDELLQAGDRIAWHPDFMRLRYRNWTENLQLDWCVSRQRYFGVPFPVWYVVKENGETDFERPLMADAKSLPVDPTTDVPPGYTEAQRDAPGGFRAETDVFDTWFTSSLTPQIVSGWMKDPARHARLFPADLRPQSHEIIRTWAFYTIVKAQLHEGEIPWRHVAISGWVLDPDRKKMSKSKGNVITPMHLLDQYGADAVRYWSLAARLGTDTAFDEKVLKVGRRLAVKLFNASKFALGQEGREGPITRELDLSFLSRLRETVNRASLAMEAFEYQAALDASERFFWSGFTDAYMEMVKARCRSAEDLEGRGSALATLQLALRTFLRLFAPFLPYVTEEVWSWSFADEAAKSVHRAPWPGEDDFAALPEAFGDGAVFDASVAFLDAVNRAKSARGATVGRHVKHLTASATPRTLALFDRGRDDAIAAARVAGHSFEANPALEEMVFEVSEAELMEPPAPQAPKA